MVKSNEDWQEEFSALPSQRKEDFFLSSAMIGGPSKPPIYNGSALHELYILKEHETDMLNLALTKPEVYQAYHPFPLSPEHVDYESFYEPWYKAQVRYHQIAITILEEEIKKRLYFFGKGNQVDTGTIESAKVSAGLEGIVTCLEEAGLQVFMNKRVWTFRCNHGTDTTPSGKIAMYNNMPSWKCFGCGKGGDILEALKVYHNYNFMESLRWLTKYTGITLIK